MNSFLDNQSRIPKAALLIAAALSLFGWPSIARAGDGEGLADIKKLDPKHGAPAPAPTPPTPGAPPPAVPPSTPFELGVFGYVRAGYEHVQKDNRYDFVGRNNGFLLESARVGLEGTNTRYHVNFRISAEAASDVQTGVNTPLGSLDVRLRDAFLRYDPAPWIGVQLGQYKAPFAQEELRGTADLTFVSRAVAQEGVLPGRGFQERGIALDRQLGLMIAPKEPIALGHDFGVAYYAMLMNGNGSNQLLDDNGHLGFVGRLEGVYGKYVTLGGALFKNDRRVGAPPNLYDEDDLGIAADLLLRYRGVELFGQYAQVKTSFPTVGASDRVQRGYHVQASYRIDALVVPFAPAYRYAHFEPWAEGGDATTGQDFDAFKLDYHTIGLRVWHPTLPIAGWINYTFTKEPTSRSLDNDRFELLVQLSY